MISKQEIMGLANDLQIQFDRLRARQEFLALKEDEARLGGEFAYPSWLTAMEECRNERLLLDAHTRILEGMIRKTKVKPPRSIALLIARIYAPPGVNVY